MRASSSITEESAIRNPGLRNCTIMGCYATRAGQFEPATFRSFGALLCHTRRALFAMVMLLLLSTYARGQKTEAGPLIIINSALCTKDTIINGVPSTKIELVLNSLTASYYNTSLYLYYSVTGSGDPWRLNGIPMSSLDLSTGIAEFILPFALAQDHDLMLGWGSSSSNLGASGSGPNQTIMVIHPCSPVPATGSICGRKVWDRNCDGDIDSNDTGLAGWVITLRPDNVVVTTDAEGNFCFGGLALNQDYYIDEVAQEGWSRTIPRSRDYHVFLDRSRTPFLSFANCRRITPEPECDEACNLVQNGDFSSSNTGFTSSLPVGCGACTAGTYCVGPMFQTKCSAWPATFDHTSGDASGRFLSVDGSTVVTSDVWRQNVQVFAGMTYTFSFWGKNVYSGTAAAVEVEMFVSGISPIGIAVVNSNTAWVKYSASWLANVTGNVSISLRQKTPGQFRDFGIDDIFFGACPCACMPRCDSMSVTPFLYNSLSKSGRTFTIHNVKSPASPIKMVKIALVPSPDAGTVQWDGGDLEVDAGSRSWVVSGTPAYSLIEMECGDTNAPQGGAAMSTVRFNLGVDYNRNWSGVVTVTTVHCDGDTCTSTYDWCAKQDPDNCQNVPVLSGILHRDIIGTKLLASRFLVNGSDSVRIRFVTIETELQDNARVFAIGAHESGSIKQGARSMAYISASSIFSNDRGSRHAAMVEFGSGLNGGDTVEVPIVVELPKSDTNSRVKLKVAYYDSQANRMRVDTTEATANTQVHNPTPGNAAASSAELYSPEPTPTSSSVRFRYWLSSSQMIGLELYDDLGKRVAAIDNGRREAGEHVILYDVTYLPSGTYFVRLTTPFGVFTEHIVVQH